MSHVTWEEYKAWLGPELKGPLPAGPAPELRALSTDTRTVKAGQWFVPIAGERFDGHEFIADAMRQGAEGFFYAAARKSEIPAEILAKGLPVGEPLAAFQKLGAGWRLSLKRLKLIGLTGSTGKTTTKEMLSQVLRVAGPTFATHASFNNEVGVPKTLQNLSPEHQYAALEFGARMPGNIKFLCEMAAPDVVGLVNVGIAHLGIFGSVENLLNTKLEIFRDSPRHAVQVAYADDHRIVNGAKNTGKKTLTFGKDAAADVRLVDSLWQAGNGTMTVKLSLLGRSLEIPFGVAHEVFPINAAAAAALATAAGVSSADIVKGLSGFRGVKGRYQVHQVGKLVLIDDTYNANPDSMRAGLTTLGRAFSGKKLVLVLGDMLELGDTSPEEHRKIGKERVAPLSPELLITVGLDALHIAEGAKAAGLAAGNIRSVATIDELDAAGFDYEKAGDVLYAKGSNGIKLGRLVDRLLGAP